MGKMILVSFFTFCAVVFTILGVLLGLINKALDKRKGEGK
jgi:hypothetical protein